MSALAGWERVAIMEERRIRHFTIEQLRHEFGENWTQHSATVRRDADIAVDRLIEAVISNQAAEDHIEGLVAELDSRAPGWENEQPWYARKTSNQDSESA